MEPRSNKKKVIQKTGRTTDDFFMLLYTRYCYMNVTFLRCDNGIADM